MLGAAPGSLFLLLTEKPWIQTLHRVLLHSSHPKAVFKGNPWACRLADSKRSLKVVVLEAQDQETQVINFYLGKGKIKLSMLYHKVKEAAGDSECYYCRQMKKTEVTYLVVDCM